jgi:hypothetical protein
MENNEKSTSAANETAASPDQTNPAAPEWLADARVAFLASVFNQSADNCSLLKALQAIRDGVWKDPVEALRAIPRSDAQRYDKQKTKLPAFMASMSSKGGTKSTDIRTHSGFLQLDIDKIGADHVVETRNRLGADPHVAAAWISPSGDGVKALMRIPADSYSHQASFLEAEKYIKATYKYTIDPSCKNVNRNCFFGYDPELVFNFNAEVLPVELPAGAPSKSRPAKVRESGTQTPSETAPTPTYSEDPHLKDNPKLTKLYKALVFDRFGEPIRGERNAQFMEIAAFLFFAVRQEFVLAFLEAYHRQHAAVMHDYPIEDVELQAKNLMENSEVSFLGNFPVDSQEYYKSLTDYEKAAFRICESLSLCESDPTTPPPTFHLSCDQLGTRLGRTAMEASRLLKRFEQSGLIRKTTNGDRYSAGKRAMASVYEWRIKRIQNP